MTQLTESEMETVKRLLNQSIHECVFALQHAEQGDGDDALNAIVLVRQNAAQAAGIIEALSDKP